MIASCEKINFFGRIEDLIEATTAQLFKQLHKRTREKAGVAAVTSL